MAAIYQQGGTLDFKDVPVPDIRNDELLLKVTAAAICGTDIKIMRNGHRKLADGQRLVLGHEFVGVVEKAGSGVKGIAKGAKVGVAPNFGCGKCDACVRGMANLCQDYSAFGINIDGAHAPFVRIPAEAIKQGNITILPEGIKPEEAALAEPLSCVIRGQAVVNIRPGDTVLIYGAGPMGLIHVLMASVSGASKIIVADPVPERLEKARESGASCVIASGSRSVPECVMRETGGTGVDVAITAAPIPQIAEEALKLLAPFGRLCLFAGLPKDKPLVNLDANMIHYRNLVVTGATGGANVDYRAAIRLIAERRVDVRKVISHSFSFAELKDAYATAVSGKCLKIVLINKE